MMDSATRTEAMEETLLYSLNLYSWRLDRSLRLLATNCTHRQSFYEWFVNGECGRLVQRHFSESARPLIVTDSLGIAWIAAAQNGWDGGLIHMLGPVFTVDASEAWLLQTCSRLGLSPLVRDVLLEQLKLIPSITFSAAQRYGSMLHFCITSQTVQATDVVSLYSGEETQEEDDRWDSPLWHGTWEHEEEMMRCITRGDFEGFTRSASGMTGNVGTLCPGNPLRQCKDEGIIFATLACRAVIREGIPPESSFRLSDRLIQQLEAAETIAEVSAITSGMAMEFINLVRRCRKDSVYSAPVAGAMEYIRGHIYEKISLEQMARELGYVGYYLSRKFKEESGQSINQYIKQQKIEQAKRLLSNPNVSIADLSDRLAFSSHSYFTAVFREHTGMTPVEYQNQLRADRSRTSGGRQE